MKNLIEHIPNKVNLTVTKEDLIDFAEYLLYEYSNNLKDLQTEKQIVGIDEVD